MTFHPKPVYKIICASLPKDHVQIRPQSLCPSQTTSLYIDKATVSSLAKKKKKEALHKIRMEG